MDTHEDTGFLINHFEPSSERGNFLNWTKYGDIPSSHGDIPVILCLIYGIGLSATTGSFKISTYWEHFFRLLQVSRMQVSRPVRSLRSDSLRYEFIISSGTQYNYFTELLPATSSFSISPTTANNSNEPITLEELSRWCFENPGKRR